MNEFRKSLRLGVASVVLYVFWASSDLRYLRPYWKVILKGPIRPGSAWTNLEGLGLLLAGVASIVFMISLLLLRRYTYRESGRMLSHTQREMEEGLGPHPLLCRRD